MTTATDTPETATSGEVLEISLDHCLPNRWNKARPVDEPFLQSLRDKGQQVIGLVRPHPEREDFYEIVFGMRRREGLLAIGQRSWRVEVRELSDQDVEELCALENAQRAGLSWQQTCEVIESYLERHQVDPDAPARIASALGITTAQVRRRHRLLEKLSKSWREVIKKNKFPLWTVDHFETLTLYPEKQQEHIYLNEYQWNDSTPTLAEFRKELAEDTRLLKIAGWDLSDATLCPAAGACAECPKRSGANTDLFDEVDPKVKGQDRCLDGECYSQKQKAFAARKVANLRKEEPEVLQVSKESYRSQGGTLGWGDFEEVKKSAKGAKKAVITEGKGAGEVVYVKPKGAKKEEVAKAMGKKPEKRSLEERCAELEKRRDALAIQKLIAYIEDEAKELEFTDEAQAVLTQYALAYGVEAEIPGMGEDEPKRIRAFAKSPFTAEELWEPVAMHLTGELQGVANSLRAGEPAATDEIVQMAAWLVDADWAELRAAAAAELPDPKSWANEAAAERMTGGKKAKASKAGTTSSEEFHEDLEDGHEADLDNEEIGRKP